MRIFTASVATETNTFAPWPTGAEAFISGGGVDPYSLVGEQFALRARAEGHEHVQSIYVSAQPSGPTVQGVYERLRAQILRDLHANPPPDVVLLALHGAMIATECDDCEGDLLEALRAAVGTSAIIGAILDPHCHLTPAMLRAADVLIGLKEYPHTDFLERGTELYELCTRAAQGGARPVYGTFDCRMVGFYPTMVEPMRGLLARIREMERQKGVLSITFIHGFPWGDTACNGSQVLVIADGDEVLAQKVAAEVGVMIYRRRRDLVSRLMTIDEALDEAEREPGCAVLADFGDNPGGGAPGDNVTVLRAMLSRGVKNAVFGVVWDPIAAGICADAGVGARFMLRLGGKCGEASGNPFDSVVRVKAIEREHWQTGLKAAIVPLGLSAWVEIGGIDVVIGSRRSQVFSPDAFSNLGINLAAKRCIVVKSSQHFRAGFEPIADRIMIMATPGALQTDFAAVAYTKKAQLEYFPRVADPLKLDAGAT
jgi:microcystin degradation protein MlrC